MFCATQNHTQGTGKAGKGGAALRKVTVQGDSTNRYRTRDGVS